MDQTYTRSHPSTSIAMNEPRLMAARSPMTCAIAAVPSAPSRRRVAVPRKTEPRCDRHVRSSSTSVTSSASPAGSPDHHSASIPITLSTAAAITKARVSTRPICAGGGGGGAGRSAMYAGTGRPSPSPPAPGSSCVPLRMRGSAPAGCSAAGGLYASSVQMRSGRQSARRTGMTNVQQAVRRRNIPGAIVARIRGRLWRAGLLEEATSGNEGRIVCG